MDLRQEWQTMQNRYRPLLSMSIWPHSLEAAPPHPTVAEFAVHSAPTLRYPPNRLPAVERIWPLMGSQA
jgi:hypothetical protein